MPTNEDYEQEDEDMVLFDKDRDIDGDEASLLVSDEESELMTRAGSRPNTNKMVR